MKSCVFLLDDGAQVFISLKKCWYGINFIPKNCPYNLNKKYLCKKTIQ